MPLLSWIDGRAGRADQALALAFDPADNTTYMRLRVSATPSGDGSFVFERRLLSVGGNASALQLAADWFVTAGCWRPALGWFVERHAASPRHR